MFIRNCLTTSENLMVVRPSDTVGQVLDLMRTHLSLPCVDETGQFVGIVSKRTIFEAFQSANESGTSYEEFQGKLVNICVDSSIPTLTLNDRFEDTIAIITRFPFVPIVEGEKFLGIVKRSDIQDALSVTFATTVDADRVLLGVAEVEGAFERLFNVTHRLNLNVITVVAFDAGNHPLNRRVLLKVEKSPKLSTLVQHLEHAGYLILKVN